MFRLEILSRIAYQLKVARGLLLRLKKKNKLFMGIKNNLNYQ